MDWRPLLIGYLSAHCVCHFNRKYEDGQEDDMRSIGGTFHKSFAAWIELKAMNSLICTQASLVLLVWGMESGVWSVGHGAWGTGNWVPS